MMARNARTYLVSAGEIARNSVRGDVSRARYMWSAFEKTEGGD